MVKISFYVEQSLRLNRLFTLLDSNNLIFHSIRQYSSIIELFWHCWIQFNLVLVAFCFCVVVMFLFVNFLFFFDNFF